MARKDVESDRDAQDARSSEKHIGNDEQRSSDLSHNWSADLVSHIGDTVASSVVVPEITLDNGRPCVKQAPAEDAESAAHSSQIVERGGNRQDADGENDLEEDDGCTRPLDGPEVDSSRSFEDFVFFIGIEDATDRWGGGKLLQI